MCNRNVCLCICIFMCIFREYPCDQVAMLNVTLLYVGSPSSSVRDIAIHLLHLLYKRFFMDDFVLASRPPPTSEDADDWRLMRDELFSGPRARSQVHLSLTLAKLHPDLTMPMFSGLSVCLTVWRYWSFFCSFCNIFPVWIHLSPPAQKSKMWIFNKVFSGHRRLILTASWLLA